MQIYGIFCEVCHPENITGLSYSEMTRTSLKNTTERMKQIRTLKKLNPIKEFFSGLYGKFDKKTDLLKKNTIFIPKLIKYYEYNYPVHNNVR